MSGPKFQGHTPGMNPNAHRFFDGFTCKEAMDASHKCMTDNGYDYSKCGEYFKAYKEYCTHSEAMISHTITAIGKAVEYKVQKGEGADAIYTWRSKKETSIPIQIELIKEDGGAIGLTENPSVLLKWMVSGPELARLVLRQFEHSDEDKHPHAAPSRVLLACVADETKPRYTIPRFCDTSGCDAG
ncbi:hypothetical protein ACROYT_G027402 [Oculina patagonica]